jgi:hypothetical protein
MVKKATLSKMKEYQKQLTEPKAPPKTKSKKATKKPAPKKEAETKVVAPVPVHKEETHAHNTLEGKEDYIPRGQRADFLKTTITISAEMLTELRALGMRRKSAKQLDTDTSALIREALTDFLKKHRT